MSEYTKNIKVNVVISRDGSKVRTSTTLNFTLCDFYFGHVMNKKKQMTLMQKGMKQYRTWLIDTVQEWAKNQLNQTQQSLELTILDEVYDAGYDAGIGTNEQRQLL